MHYYKFDFQTGTSDNDVLIAFLSMEPFDTFVENEHGFDAFLPEAAYNKGLEENLSELQERFAFTYSKEFIESQNWNEAWEANFNPIQVDDFCGLRAHFHPPMQGVEHELVITPKMAFGTGHHETTFMMIQRMKEIDFVGKSVLDFGCGTGVLAILASRLGAAFIDAVDIEEASWQNTTENCETNSISNVNAYKGELGTVSDKTYDIVLANINRNVILSSLDTLSTMIPKTGTLLLSGIMKNDGDILQNALIVSGFKPFKIIGKNNWLAMQCVRE